MEEEGAARPLDRAAGEAVAGGEAAAGREEGGAEQDEEKGYLAWKRNLMYLYDNFAHGNMTWPSLTVCWGPCGNSFGHRDDDACAWRSAFVATRTGTMRVPPPRPCPKHDPSVALTAAADATFSEETQSWQGRDPSLLHLMDVRVLRTRVADPRSLAKFSESTRSSVFSIAKTIVHPGEVNRARCA